MYSALAAILRNDSDEKACTFAISKCGRRIILQAPFVLWWKKSQLLCSCTALINFHAWIISISLSPLFGRGERKAIWHNMKCHYWQAIQEKEKVLTAILDTPSFANDLRQCIYRLFSWQRERLFKVRSPCLKLENDDFMRSVSSSSRSTSSWTRSKCRRCVLAHISILRWKRRSQSYSALRERKDRGHAEFTQFFKVGDPPNWLAAAKV